MIPKKEKVLPLVDWSDPDSASAIDAQRYANWPLSIPSLPHAAWLAAIDAQREADWLVVLALAEALEWALAKGGWRLPYYATDWPAILKVPYVGWPAEIDWDTLMGRVGEQ